MKITYTGSTPLEIDHDGTTTHVQSGQTIEVSVAVGAELCARKDFQRAAAHPESRIPQPESPKTN
jgi:hypothetical protein